MWSRTHSSINKQNKSCFLGLSDGSKRGEGRKTENTSQIIEIRKRKNHTPPDRTHDVRAYSLNHQSSQYHGIYWEENEEILLLMTMRLNCLILMDILNHQKRGFFYLDSGVSFTTFDNFLNSGIRRDQSSSKFRYLQLLSLQSHTFITDTFLTRTSIDTQIDR